MWHIKIANKWKINHNTNNDWNFAHSDSPKNFFAKLKSILSPSTIFLLFILVVKIRISSVLQELFLKNRDLSTRIRFYNPIQKFQNTHDTRKSPINEKLKTLIRIMKFCPTLIFKNYGVRIGIKNFTYSHVLFWWKNQDFIRSIKTRSQNSVLSKHSWHLKIANQWKINNVDYRVKLCPTLISKHFCEKLKSIFEHPACAFNFGGKISISSVAWEILKNQDFVSKLRYHCQSPLKNFDDTKIAYSGTYLEQFEQPAF